MFCIIDDVDVATYADDNTPYTHGKCPNKVLEKLEYASRNEFEWFFINAMKVNSDKWHFPTSLVVNTKIAVSSFDIENTRLQKVFVVTIDRKLNFHDCVLNLYKKPRWLEFFQLCC